VQTLVRAGAATATHAHVRCAPHPTAVDDHRLRNPLQRHERMSTEWFGCILEVRQGR